MPIHDWTRVPSGLFHDFHQTWTIHIKMALNAGLLPKGMSALVEQKVGSKESDVLAVESRKATRNTERDDGGSLLTAERPLTSIVRHTTAENYAGKANRIVVKHHLGRIVAVIEIVSPGNKDSRVALRDFVDKNVEFLRQGIHVLVVDLFPPTRRDPVGIHKLIWEGFQEEDFVFPHGKDRVLASYQGGTDRWAFVEPITVGDALPPMPLYLATGLHIKVPLEPTYQSTWNASPEEMRLAVETGVMPEADVDDD